MGFCFGLCHGLCTVSVRSLYRDQIAQSGDDDCLCEKYRFSQQSLLHWSLCGLRAAIGSPPPSPSPFAPRQSPARPRRRQRRKAVAPKGRNRFLYLRRIRTRARTASDPSSFSPLPYSLPKEATLLFRKHYTKH